MFIAAIAIRLSFYQDKIVSHSNNEINIFLVSFSKPALILLLRVWPHIFLRRLAIICDEQRKGARKPADAWFQRTERRLAGDRLSPS
jgi:hypothetical protein